MKLVWDLDTDTAYACKKYPICFGDEAPARQYEGHAFRVENWQHRLLTRGDFEDNILVCSPSEIMRCFREERYLAGLALVVSWGGMARTSRYIYGPHNLRKLDRTLRECQHSINKTKRLDDAWHSLTTDLAWSAVIASKTLHFMCRSLGCNRNPPVPIDNAVMLQKVWPFFTQEIPRHLRPGDWSGRTFASYNRYMTAILVWASQQCWTTTQVENTLFSLAR